MLKQFDVLLEKIEGPGAGIPSIIIYLLLINQPMGKGYLCVKIPGGTLW